MRHVLSWLRRHGLDLLVLAGAILAAVEVIARRDDIGLPTGVGAACDAALVLALLARHRWPFAAPAALWVGAAALSLVDGYLVTSSAAVYAAGLVSAFLLGNLRDERQGRIGLAITVGGAAIVVLNAPDFDGTVIVVPLMFALAWLGGLAQRSRAVAVEVAEERARLAELERESAARIAVAEERARIARELHDVVAHAISVMVLQAGVVRRRIGEDRPDDAEVLTGVEQTGRTALNEMRRMLGALRREDDEVERGPQPGLGHLDTLIAELRRAGLPVELRVDGEPYALPDGVDLSAFRIIQEALTNALKHSGDARRVDVVLRYGADELGIDVCDDGSGTGNGGGSGHGLVGIRERVKIYGGSMTAGPGEDGGFEVHTRLPVGGAHA